MSFSVLMAFLLPRTAGTPFLAGVFSETFDSSSSSISVSAGDLLAAGFFPGTFLPGTLSTLLPFAAGLGGAVALAAEPFRLPTLSESADESRLLC